MKFLFIMILLVTSVTAFAGEKGNGMGPEKYIVREA